jgi:hypothetical protein
VRITVVVMMNTRHKPVLSRCVIFIFVGMPLAMPMSTMLVTADVSPRILMCSVMLCS